MKRQTCCICLQTTTDYVTQHIYHSPSDRRSFHYCAKCAEGRTILDIYTDAYYRTAK